MFNNEGNIDSIDTIKRNNAHRLIEEMMLVANVAAAEFVEKQTKNAIFRIHDTPKEEKLRDLNL